ncbi:hypothetical protein BH23CHL2_BH23CHL2_31310 [soil metagenome]
MPDHRRLVRTPFLEQSPLDHYRGIEQRCQRNERAILISEGDDGIESNFAAVFGPIGAAEFFEMAREFFGRQPFAVIVESESASFIEDLLNQEGWTLDEEEVTMVLAPVPEASPPPTGLHILPVDTAGAYEDFMRVVPGNRAWVPSLEAATDPDVALFVGYDDTLPVASSRLVRYGDIAEITAVQTLEGRRRRGYGRAMTWAAIVEARRRGCRTIILTATEMGYLLYRGMGFETVCSYRTYLPPGSV